MSQSNLATDLHTDANGTGFPGYWVSTMNYWFGSSRYISTWAPDYTQNEWRSYYEAANYLDIFEFGYGYINDTHMVSGGKHLDGYATGSEYWHYVAGDGIDQRTSPYLVHYEDSSKSDSYPTRYGPHWDDTIDIADMTHDRGIIW